MKLQFLSLVAASIAITFSSCSDMLSTDFDATFDTRMQIDIVETKSTVYPFSSTSILNIEDEQEVKKNIDRIKKLNITQIDCTLTGIPEGETITEMNIKVEEANLLFSLSNLTQNHKFTLPVQAEFLNALSSYLLTNKKTSITVSGNSTYAPMTLGVKLEYISKITASL